MHRNIIFLILIFLFLNSDGQVFIPRYADLKIEFIEPSPLTEIQSPIYLPSSFLMTNQGPDTLYPDDTLVWQYYYSSMREESLPPIRKVAIGSFVAPDQHLVYFDTVFINSKFNNDNMLFTFQIEPRAYGLQTDKRSLHPEFYEDYMKDNSPAIRLIHKAPNSASILNLENKINVFPNPSNGVIFIQSNKAIVDWSIELIDGLGVKHNCRTIETQMNNTYKLDFGDISPGLYIIRIKLDKYIESKPIIIQ